ncbi:MAG TPA: hypothetical protein VJB14_09175, partial [Planctomycetota bacterium]|nr:hypothetical protein [Planctomycetota bacterium]
RDLALRMVLGAAAVLFAAGAMLIHVKDRFHPGRSTAMGLLLVGMPGVSLFAGAMIDRNSGETPTLTVANTFRALLDSLQAPVNLLAMGGLLLFSASVISFEHEPGSYRVGVSRVLVLATYLMAFAFGAEEGLLVPLKRFMTQPELSIPLATATGLAAIFGLLLLTGYNFEAGARTFGLVLSVAAAGGLFAFAVLVSEAEPRLPGKNWLDLLLEPFADLGRNARNSGTPVALAVALAFLERTVLAGAIRKQDRVRRRF